MMIILYHAIGPTQAKGTMKVTREQAAANRERVLDTAARLFRERGFGGIGVADLMQEAGLTHGGFYGQFASKEALAAEACARVHERSMARWARRIERDGKAGFAAIADAYLSARHRDDPGQGCALPALGADVARRDPALRRVFSNGVRAMLALLDGVVPGRTQARRRERAMAALASMVGGIVLARAVDDAELSQAILAAARASLPR